MKLAQEKAKETLGGYHTYVDGQIDRPLFNSETVEYDSEKIKEEIKEEIKTEE